MHRGVLEACLPWLGLLAAGCAGLTFAVRLSGARLQLRRLRRLHECQAGSVQTLSFVLTLPIFIIFTLFIVQVSQLMVGVVLVHHAAFAAARAASVWIPARLEFEVENRVSATDVVSKQTGETYSILPVGEKYQRIKTAAVLALLPSAPSRELPVERGILNGPLIETLKQLYASLSPDSQRNARIPARLENKLAYAWQHTEVLITAYDKDDHDSGPTYNPRMISEDGQLLREPEIDEVGWQDPVTITVRHQFALLPGAGRLLATRVVRQDGVEDALSQQIGRRSGYYVREIAASMTLGAEGIQSVIPYQQPNP